MYESYLSISPGLIGLMGPVPDPDCCTLGGGSGGASSAPSSSIGDVRSSRLEAEDMETRLRAGSGGGSSVGGRGGATGGVADDPRDGEADAAVTVAGDVRAGTGGGGAGRDGVGSAGGGEEALKNSQILIPIFFALKSTEMTEKIPLSPFNPPN